MKNALQILVCVALLAFAEAQQPRMDTSVNHRNTRKVVKQVDQNNPNLWKKWTFPIHECGDGSRYTVVHGDNGEIGYKEAWAACSQAGGRLAHFENEAKYQEVIKYVQGNPFINSHCAAKCGLDDNACIYWVGAKTFGKHKEGWQWVDGPDATSGIPIVDGWPEFPQNVQEDELEENVFMFLNPDYAVEYPTFGPYKFGDYGNQPVCGFICEIPSGGYEPVPVYTTKSPVPVYNHSIITRHTPYTTRTPTPAPLSCRNGGVAVCWCDPGWTGPYCDTPIDWCNEYVETFVDCRNDRDCTCDGEDKAVTYRMACQPHGTCLSNEHGAFCECQPGYEGPFCEKPIPNPSRIYIRRCSYLGYPLAHYDDGAPLPARDRACPTGYWCVPDDLNCFDPMASCPNYIGWCVPAQTDHTVLSNEMIAMFLAERNVKV